MGERGHGVDRAGLGDLPRLVWVHLALLKPTYPNLTYIIKAVQRRRTAPLHARRCPRLCAAPRQPPCPLTRLDSPAYLVASLTTPSSPAHLSSFPCAGAVAALQRLRDAGVLTAVVSNFDTRLRPLLRDLAVQGLFDEVVVSAEVRRGRREEGGGRRARGPREEACGRLGERSGMQPGAEGLSG